MTTFVFDGAFEGLLTAVFEFYERKPGKVKLVDSAHFHPTIIGDEPEIISDETKVETRMGRPKKEAFR
jgi:tetraacyldisaccharide-1-P 4'-kinase